MTDYVVIAAAALNTHPPILRIMSYPTLFRNYILRSAEYVLVRIQQTEKANLPTDDRELALHTLSFTLKLAEAWSLTRKLLFSLAPKMERAGYREEWIVYLKGGLEQSQQFGDREAEAELHFYLGVLYQELADFENARRHFLSGIAYFESIAQPHDHARFLNRLAYVARLQHQWNEAVELAEKALELADSVQAEQAYGLMVLGTVAYDQREWEKANQFFSKSLSLWEETKKPRLIAWGLTNQGTALRRLERYAEAITSYQKAITLFETHDVPVDLAIAKMNLGNVYVQIERLNEALVLYREAEPIFRQTQERFRLALVTYNKGIAWLDLKNWDEAEDAFLSSIEHWKFFNNFYLLISSLEGLGLVYMKQGFYEKSAATFQTALDKYQLISDNPNYEHLFFALKSHLKEAKETVVINGLKGLK